MSETLDPAARFRPPVPQAVQRAAAAADAAFAASQASDPPAPEPAAPEPAPAPAPVPAEPVTPVVTPPAAEPVNWEHRYNSLKGKHDAEMARLQDEVSGLHRVLAAMQAAPPAGPGAPAAAPAPVPADLTFQPITDEERQDYGDEFLSVAERAAASKFVPIIAGLRAEIDGLKGQLTGVQTFVAQDAHRDAMSLLAREVPDYQAMNTDQAFLGWLQGLDDFSGRKRQELLDIAVQANNGPRIVAFFKAYKALQPGAAANPPASPASPPPRTSLETFAAPGRGQPGTSAGTPGAGSKPVYTQSQISKFYEDVRKGMYRHNPAEKARTEADIVAAASEGRIRAG